MIDKAQKARATESRVRKLVVPAEEGQLSKVRDFVTEVCREAGFSTRETNNTKLAIDEACTNIIKHAYAGEVGEITIEVKIKLGELEVTLTDRGEKFDFASIKDPDLNQYVESGRKGGLGVFLINRLMDRVDYRAGEQGNTLTLVKRSQAAARALPGHISWRSSLKFKFTVRAGVGLFFLIAAIATYTFLKQTQSIREQKAGQWMERRRLAANLSNRSKDFLLNPEPYSPEQTSLTSYITRLVETSGDIAYVRVVGPDGKILSSSHIDEIFTPYRPPQAEVLVQEGGVRWTRFAQGGRFIREVAFPVEVRDPAGAVVQRLGTLRLGLFEEAVEGSVKDPRPMTGAILLGVYLIGVLLVMGLVSVFVRPIQMLTDGVRAIGEGTLEGKISVDGPAEIGAIAAVFNEITEKFKEAQDSILEQEKLQKEMEVAKQIQQSLLPKRMPAVSGYDIAPLYQAAAEVGGDYYDFVDVDEDTIGVVVADVSGKGVPGSLVMTMIRTALRMEARGNKNASDVMAKMNDFVTDDMKRGMFVTMFYVILDSKNRTISYASAGHNPMILYRAEKNETYFLNPKGFPVGISLPDDSLFRRSITLEKIKLKRDDMLIIYTDGVTEAMNERREQYGEDRLLEVIKRYGRLHPREFIARLEEDIKDFTGGSPQNDDITIVAIKEKLTADDVLYGIRKRLIEMVEVEGMGVREACRKMKVSPATYYRYKKRLELMGERGLKNKVLREQVELRRVSIEQRREILEIIRRHPEYGAKRITATFNKDRPPSAHLSEKLVYEELRRLNLNTKELRLEYLRRNRLLPGKEVVEEGTKRQVEEFLREVAEAAAEEAVAGGGEKGSVEALDMGPVFSLVVEKEKGEVTVLKVRGHLDSVSSAGFEQKLKELIDAGAYRIVVDLQEMSYISSGGWGIFAGQVKQLREKGGDVVLAAMTPEVYDVFELLGFGEILRAFPDRKQAVAYFSLPVEERFAPLPTPGLGESTQTLSEREEIPGEGHVPEWESLRIEGSTVGEEGEIAVLSLTGIIDTVSAESLRAALDRVISSGRNKIIVDMSQVEYASSGGWGTFTERLREVRRSGGDIKLFGMDPDVYYVFTMLGFNIVLASYDVMADAIEAFDERARPLPALLPKDRRAKGRRAGEEAEERLDALTGEGMELEETTAAAGKVVSTRKVREGVWVAELFGTLETTALQEWEGEMEGVLDREPDLLLFDLSRVAYISSSGWGLFAKFHERLSRWGGRMALCGMSQALYEIYSCLEFHAFVPAWHTVDEALAGVEAAEEEEAETSKRGLGARATPDVQKVADKAGAEPAGEETLSIDEILAEPGEREGGEVAEEVGSVGGARDRDRLERGGEVGQEGEEAASKETRWSKEPLALEDSGSASPLEQDAKLREMGWKEYGRRLKKHQEKKRGGEGE